MRKKQLNTEGVINELKQGSVFFKKDDPVDNHERSVRPDRLDGPERPVRVHKKKREIRRHAFEIFRDQIPHLQRLKVEYMLDGEFKSMSAMVREAIDSFLANNSIRTGQTPRTESTLRSDRTDPPYRPELNELTS